jgi:hypothetical protein
MRILPVVIVASIVASIVALGCTLAGADVRGNGKARTEQRTVPAFKGLSVGGAVQIEVTVGGAQSVALTGDDNVLPIIRTRVVDGTLIVDSKKSYSSKTPLVLRITTPSLAALSTSGSSSGFVKGIAGSRFAVNVSGSGNVELTGKTEALAIDVSGSAEIRARAVRAAAVTANVSGSGAIEVTATDALAADVSGSASIDYWGNPKTVARDVSGSGSINAR